MIFCIFSMSCSWAGLLRATGYSPKYMESLLPLAWTSFVLKTTCERSSRSNDTLFKKNLFRNKAVSDGAISFYVDHFVRTRVSKFTYGCFCIILYNSSDPDHRSRSHRVFTDCSGEKVVNDSFDIILPKVSCLISFLQNMLLKHFILRIPKFQRRRNSECLIEWSRKLRLIYELFVVLFGVTAETSWLQSGKTLIPVRDISQLFLASL